jgi:hypothetical protein
MAPAIINFITIRGKSECAYKINAAVAVAFLSNFNPLTNLSSSFCLKKYVKLLLYKTRKYIFIPDAFSNFFQTSGIEVSPLSLSLWVP